MLKKILGVTVILLTIIFSCFGCASKRNLYQREHFIYYATGSFGMAIAIDGFTDKGKELETVVVVLLLCAITAVGL